MPSPKPQTELALIQQIRKASTLRTPALKLGIGDDCAILALPPGHEILVTTDFSLESRHFRRDWHTPESAGHRTLARGLSDLAAMGAKPLAAFLSLALPKETDPRWTKRFLAGLLALAAQHKVPLAGGDTAQAPGEHILADIVLLGSAPRGQALRRSGARPGDRIFVSGALGGSAAQLLTLPSQPFPSQTRGPQTHPEPRLALGQALLRRKLATSCIDLSDGLSTDLTHLCQASGVGASLTTSAIPLHPLAAGDLALALHGGEDYELLFTASPSTHIPNKIAGIPLTQIGEITVSSRILLDGKPLKPQGWQHFVD